MMIYKLKVFRVNLSYKGNSILEFPIVMSESFWEKDVYKLAFEYLFNKRVFRKYRKESTYKEVDIRYVIPTNTYSSSSTTSTGMYFSWGSTYDNSNAGKTLRSVVNNLSNSPTVKTNQTGINHIFDVVYKGIKETVTCYIGDNSIVGLGVSNDDNLYSDIFMQMLLTSNFTINIIKDKDKPDGIKYFELVSGERLSLETNYQTLDNFKGDIFNQILYRIEVYEYIKDLNNLSKLIKRKKYDEVIRENDYMSGSVFNIYGDSFFI